jgi:orotate phosphoribosyltransferase
MNKKIAKILLNIKAVTFRFDPPYTYTSGLKSPIYLDNRLVMSYPDQRKIVIDAYIKAIKEQIGLDNVESISATATAAIPQGAWIAHRLKLPLVYARNSTKKHGKEQKIEGHLKKGKKVLIVEDHISTGQSAVDNANAVRDSGANVEYCISTTTYETQKSIDNFKNNNIKLIHLTTGKIIIKTAFESKLLSKEEKDRVDLWFQNPTKWAKN